jgi:hypothetical protein
MFRPSIRNFSPLNRCYDGPALDSASACEAACSMATANAPTPRIRALSNTFLYSLYSPSAASYSTSMVAFIFMVRPRPHLVVLNLPPYCFLCFFCICQSVKASSAVKSALSSDLSCARSNHCWASASRAVRIALSRVQRARSRQSDAACRNLASSSTSIVRRPRPTAWNEQPALNFGKTSSTVLHCSQRRASEAPVPCCLRRSGGLQGLPYTAFVRLSVR